ncbi:Aldehyde:ferredoxin oxidoreductase [Mesotoga infera]|uniref:Aldehyde:ferredoxin oxidoreductase n=1 Tax=Mesotoga infera TaxID=1236046 RepID=A0A7Z7LEK6_9BACT|nr:aldehyde ferredoxin oxidoreductase N-terminal domain-containing protein [Mesotoga infera]SSC12545.1 Aldehyde:ferredoxin oxidoreductase [Mesotoga infera]
MILNIDLNKKSSNKEEYRHFVAGRTLSSRLIAKYVQPDIHPLSQKNVLVICPASFAGTPVPNSNRLSIGAKSPLTGGIKESNIGGRVPDLIARSGIRAITVSGALEELSVLIIDKGNCRFEKAPELKGLMNYELFEKLYEKYGKNVGILGIGPAGENKLINSTISGNDLEGHASRHAGRGGMGAVMGSKNIKAIIFLEPGSPMIMPPEDTKKEFLKVSRDFAQRIIKSKVNMTLFSNLSLVSYINRLGALPIRNYRESSSEEALALSGENIVDELKSRGGRMGHACSKGCVVRCSNIIHDKNGEYVTSGFEYESIVMLGSNLGIFNFDKVVPLERFCDEFGLDTIETGASFAVAAEAGLAEFGNAESFSALTHEIRSLSPFGRLLASGSGLLGKVFGITRVPAIKNQSMAAYDPRGLKGTGTTYATSTMGADHTAGNVFPAVSKVDVRNGEGQVAESLYRQIMYTAFDIFLCIYVGATEENLDTIATLVNLFYNEQITKEDIFEIAKSTITLEMKFNEACGLNSRHNLMPEFFIEEEDSRGNKYDVPNSELRAAPEILKGLEIRK